MAKKPLEIDMCAGSQLRDTQGEMLSIEGADISELEAGRGRFNDNHGKGFFNSIGRVTLAKKIFKAEDCVDDRQKYYWEKVKAPYVYVRGFLYDDEDHPNARAAAAILRNIHKSDCPLKIKASVEGGVVARGIADPSLLARTKIHSLALTFTPANNATLVEPLSLDKSALDEATDMNLIKSVMHLAQTDVPSFRHIIRDASATKVCSNIEKIAQLVKQEGANIHVPSKQEILQYALESKIQSNVIKIKEAVLVAKQDELEKGIKGKLAGAAMMGATAFGTPAPHTPAPHTPAAQQVNLAHMPSVHGKKYKEFATKNPLLGAIGMVESSGGVNYDHHDSPEDNAAGMFGMRPSAAQYILNNAPELAKKYPDLVTAAKDLKSHGEVIRGRFNSDPQAAYDFADALLKRYKTKTKGTNMLIHAWNHGLKGTWERFKNEGKNAIDASDYVKKVLKNMPKHTPKKSAHKVIKPTKKAIVAPKAIKPIDQHMKKALTAGYGGAGAPTANTSGGVLQAEALDDGRGSFKYITCGSCGKEQVYSKYQVRCRDCGREAIIGSNDSGGTVVVFSRCKKTVVNDDMPLHCLAQAIC